MNSEKTMRILFLAPVVPWPLTQGRNLRNFHLLRILAERHEVELLCGSFDAGSPALPSEVAALVEFGEVVAWPGRPLATRLLDMGQSVPDIWQTYASDRLVDSAWARHATKPFDCVHVAGFEMMGTWNRVRDRLTARIPYVLDEHNIEYSLRESMQAGEALSVADVPYRIYNHLQTHRTRRHETGAWQRAWHVSTVSPEDRAQVLKHVPAHRVSLVPNCLDIRSLPKVERNSVRPHSLLFMGKMDYRPNVAGVTWFCREAMPVLRERFPDASFTILGRDPAADVRTLNDMPGVTVTGYVESLVPYLEQAATFVVPLFQGGGTRFKVLEALATGIPLVSTNQGIAGLPLENETHCLLADNPNDLATAIERTWTEPATTWPRVANGQRLVEARFDWSAIAPTLAGIYV
ncbi:MAG: glycosyltransferase [Caldilineaceae bacterium]|nr:glycosyltransferase [Caldilineaceae bacterium]